MSKLLEHQTFRNLLSAVAFGICYSILSFIDKGYVEMALILETTVLYFLFMCLFCFAAPKIRKITGHDK